MSTGTTLVKFKKAMVTALKARPGMSDVEVSYGFAEDYIAEKAVWFEGARSSDRIATLKAGTKRVEENYNVNLVIQVLCNEGETQDEADEHAAAILTEVQQCLAENPQLIPEILWASLEGWEHKIGSLPKGGGHGSGFNCRIGVRARLYP